MASAGTGRRRHASPEVRPAGRWPRGIPSVNAAPATETRWPHRGRPRSSIWRGVPQRKRRRVCQRSLRLPLRCRRFSSRSRRFSRWSPRALPRVATILAPVEDVLEFEAVAIPGFPTSPLVLSAVADVLPPVVAVLGPATRVLALIKAILDSVGDGRQLLLLLLVVLSGGVHRREPSGGRVVGGIQRSLMIGQALLKRSGIPAGDR